MSSLKKPLALMLSAFLALALFGCAGKTSGSAFAKAFDESKNYFDVVESYECVTPAGEQHMALKVKPKISAYLLIMISGYDAEEKKITESSYLGAFVEGKETAFGFEFETAEEIASFKVSVTEDTFDKGVGDFDGVEITDYEISDGSLHLSVEQTKDNIGPLSHFNILCFKEKAFVGLADYSLTILGLPSTDLDGKGTTETADVRLDFDADSIEWYYIP